jgi:1,4-alpha-glucan branching enzyme
MRLHDAGLFAGALPTGVTRYQLRARFGDTTVELHDPYRFPPILSDFDLHLLGEGTHQHLYEKLGAHPMMLDGVEGVGFVVLAPNARRVSVVGDFNFWEPRRHPMRVRGNGYWEIFIPGAICGDRYKFDIIGPLGPQLPLKSDPMAFAAETRPDTASVIIDIARLPRSAPAPDRINALSAPISI